MTTAPHPTFSWRRLSRHCRPCVRR